MDRNLKYSVIFIRRDDVGEFSDGVHQGENLIFTMFTKWDVERRAIHSQYPALRENSMRENGICISPNR